MKAYNLRNIYLDPKSMSSSDWRLSEKFPSLLDWYRSTTDNLGNLNLISCLDDWSLEIGSVAFITHKTLKLKLMKIPQFVGNQRKFLILYDFTASLSYNLRNSRFDMITFHSSDCSFQREIPHFVAFVRANKSFNLRNSGLIWKLKVPQFAGCQRTFLTL